MDDPSRVRRALEHALPPDPVAIPTPHQDLAHARTALRNRSRRRLRLGLGALALVMVAGVGVTGVLSRDGRTEDTTTSAGPGSIDLLAMTLHARPYSFDLTPKGWSVQARNPYFVTIVPDDGSASTDPDVFIGKLVITFDHNAPGGQPYGGSGRKVWFHVDSDYTTLSMRTSRGEPAGMVRIQYPDRAGWQRPTMVRFLRSVHVGAGARPSLG
ncbi:MAG TPA: hypothetical protein VH085_13555 [Nocardioides sp.]|jgi:hypothetical protein|nr:hypothetical protein [Nocardioides sp.]